MQAVKKFLKATIIGGIVFLVPLALLLLILRRALHFAGLIAKPISEKLPLDGEMRLWSITIIAVAILIFISFIAGIISRTAVGKHITQWFEKSILGGFPQYQMVKSMAEGLVQIESAESVKPALIYADECWQVGYHIEELEKGWVTAFLPQSPTPMSGNILILPADRVRLLDIPMTQAMSIIVIPLINSLF